MITSNLVVKASIHNKANNFLLKYANFIFFNEIIQFIRLIHWLLTKKRRPGRPFPICE